MGEGGRVKEEEKKRWGDREKGTEGEEGESKKEGKKRKREIGRLGEGETETIV